MAPHSVCSSPSPHSFIAPATVPSTSKCNEFIIFISIFTFSWIIHLCILRPPKNYKSWPAFGWHTYQGLKNVLHRCDRAMIYVFIAGSYFPWLTLENPNHSTILFCMEWIIWLMAAFGIAYQQVIYKISYSISYSRFNALCLNTYTHTALPWTLQMPWVITLATCSI